jgi:hypothetical protein
MGIESKDDIIVSEGFSISEEKLFGIEKLESNKMELEITEEEDENEEVEEGTDEKLLFSKKFSCDNEETESTKEFSCGEDMGNVRSLTVLGT